MTKAKSLDQLNADNKKPAEAGFLLNCLKAAFEGSFFNYSFWRSMKLFMLDSAKLNH
jgi:hypothetical protein